MVAAKGSAAIHLALSRSHVLTLSRMIKTNLHSARLFRGCKFFVEFFGLREIERQLSMRVLAAFAAGFDVHDVGAAFDRLALIVGAVPKYFVDSGPRRGHRTS